jgi:hypothetical protein
VKGLIEVAQLTSSLKMDIFGTPVFFFPTFKVSPAQGRASGVFSFLRSASDPMLSQPSPLPLEVALAGSSPSEKMASLAFPDRAAPPPVFG